MSNPYGGGFPPYEPPSGGQHGEYGGHTANNPYAGNPAPRPTDGISIAALVCSLTCCAAPVGIGLGIAGLLRTSGGQRSGRWAAITGLAIGSLVMVAGLAFSVFAVVMGSKTVFEDEASVGQCIGWDLFNDAEKAKCGDPHYAEIVWTGQFTRDLANSFENQSVDTFCSSLDLSDDYREAAKNPDLQFGISIDAFDEDEPDAGDWFFCYLERTDGETFEGRVGESSTSTGA
ncbi:MULTISPECIES: DUF4190 domain-containing protein [unclassified Nocardioides]|uniref:DUF4190 domain-containing protein n=1 Tax=unclassified Nocardioides TaxID=2615069 RepID=UPI0006FECC04|nr:MULTISPECIES: DUF4190 domain-containing protein [unclassified Nocardioides]KRA29701.1 hypothetical protein ASD81_22400 [Nocardioides sp. Root614]KRA88123.1 hypothetical protein ASD84_19215 [Nocardioides sp. Root682]